DGGIHVRTGTEAEKQSCPARLPGHQAFRQARAAHNEVDAVKVERHGGQRESAFYLWGVTLRHPIASTPFLCPTSPALLSRPPSSSVAQSRRPQPVRAQLRQPPLPPP